MRTLAISMISLALALSGCTGMVQARNDMMQEKIAYTQCLQENSANPGQCAGLREAYEADLQAYRATTAEFEARFDSGHSVFVDQTISN